MRNLLLPALVFALLFLPVWGPLLYVFLTRKHVYRHGRYTSWRVR